MSSEAIVAEIEQTVDFDRVAQLQTLASVAARQIRVDKQVENRALE